MSLLFMSRMTISIWSVTGLSLRDFPVYGFGSGTEYDKKSA